MEKKIIENLIFEKIPSLLLILLPLSLITGPFISDLSVSIIAIIFILKCLIKNNYSYFKNKFFKYFIFFYIVCLLSSLLSEYKLISSIKSFFYFRFGFFALSVLYLLSENKKLLDYIFYSLFLSFLVLIFDGFFQYFYGKNIIGLVKHDVRVSSFFGEELILGSYLSRFLPILIGVFYLTSFVNKKHNVFFFLIVIILSIALIFLSGERTAFFLTILSLVYIILMPNEHSKKIITISILATCLIVFLNINNPAIKVRMFDYTKDQLGLSNKNVESTRIYKGHFLVAKDLFIENPILGVGPKNYVQHCYKNEKFQILPYVCSTHPHNTYIQLLAETGLVGTSTILLLFIFFSYYSLKHIYYKLFKKVKLFNFSEICLLSSILITLWPFITSGNFFNNFLSIIYFYPIGILMWLRKN